MSLIDTPHWPSIGISVGISFVLILIVVFFATREDYS
jgi:hypothetical protein